MEAAQEGHIEIVKFLISKNANIHAVTNTMDTCLTYACANGHTDIAQLLIRCGANVVSTCIFMYMYSTVSTCMVYMYMQSRNTMYCKHLPVQYM